MKRQDWRAQQSIHLIRVGMTVFLVALVIGLMVPRFAVPRLGLSVHLLGLMQGIFLTVLGLVWPHLNLTRSWSRAGLWLAVYGCIAAWTSNLLAASWGGSAMLPIASGPARSSAMHDGIITLGLRSSAASLVAATVLILCGLWRSKTE
jgi:hydroxylaminobenzene mutase